MYSYCIVQVQFCKRNRIPNHSLLYLSITHIILSSEVYWISKQLLQAYTPELRLNVFLMAQNLMFLHLDCLELICALLDDFSVGKLMLTGSTLLVNKISHAVRSFRIYSGHLKQQKFPRIISRFVRLHTLTLGSEHELNQTNLIWHIDWEAVPRSIRTLELFNHNGWLSLFRMEDHRRMKRMRDLSWLFPDLTTLRINHRVHAMPFKDSEIERPLCFPRHLTVLHLRPGLIPSDVNVLPKSLLDLSFRMIYTNWQTGLSGGSLAISNPIQENLLWLNHISFPPSLTRLNIESLSPEFPLEIIPSSVTDLSLSTQWARSGLFTALEAWPPKIRRLLYRSNAPYKSIKVSNLPRGLESLELGISELVLDGSEIWPPALQSLKLSKNVPIHSQDPLWAGRLPKSLTIAEGLVLNAKAWHLLPRSLTDLKGLSVTEIELIDILKLPIGLTELATKSLSPSFSHFPNLVKLSFDATATPNTETWMASFPHLTSLCIENCSRWSSEILESYPSGQLSSLSLYKANALHFRFDKPWASGLQSLKFVANSTERHWYLSPKALPSSPLPSPNKASNARMLSASFLGPASQRSLPDPVLRTSNWINSLPRSLRALSLESGVFSAFAEPLLELRCHWPPLLESLRLDDPLSTSHWPDFPTSLVDLNLALDASITLTIAQMKQLPQRLHHLAIELKLNPISLNGDQDRPIPFSLRRVVQILPKLSTFVWNRSLLGSKTPRDPETIWKMTLPSTSKNTNGSKKRSHDEILIIN